MTGRLGRMRGKTMPDDGDFVWTVRVVTSFSQRPKCALLQNMCYDTSLRKQAAKGARKGRREGYKRDLAVGTVSLLLFF